MQSTAVILAEAALAEMRAWRARGGIRGGIGKPTVFVECVAARWRSAGFALARSTELEATGLVARWVNSGEVKV